MNESFNEMNKSELLVNPSIFANNLMFFKVDALAEQFSDLENRLIRVEQEQRLQNINESSEFFPIEDERRAIKKRNMSSTCETNSLQECEKIIQRTTELLDEWEETEDIKVQVQYAALVVGKISNVKKKQYVSSDVIKVKICTLLKNTIRLNVAEEMFTKEQILLLKKGILLILKNDVEKDALLQLNRELRTEGLLTMPAWE